MCVCTVYTRIVLVFELVQHWARLMTVRSSNGNNRQRFVAAAATVAAAYEQWTKQIAKTVSTTAMPMNRIEMCECVCNTENTYKWILWFCDCIRCSAYWLRLYSFDSIKSKHVVFDDDVLRWILLLEHLRFLIDFEPSFCFLPFEMNGQDFFVMHWWFNTRLLFIFLSSKFSDRICNDDLYVCL